MKALARSEWTWLVVGVLVLQTLPVGGSLQTWVAGTIGLAWLLFLSIRQPAVAAALVVLGAAYVGGPAVLAAAPLVLLLGHRATRSFRSGPVPGQRRRLAGAALLAALATLPFARLGYERLDAGSGGARRSAAAEPTVDGSPLLEAIARLLRRLPADDPATRWWLWALLAFFVLLLVALVIWLVRRRRRRAAGVATASVVARLESVGRRVGRRRRSDEGVLAYAAALAARTGDQRIGQAGPEVSALVYRSGAASGERVERALGSLEASPPPKPPRLPWPDRWRSARARAAAQVTPFRAMVAMAAVMIVVGAGAVVIPRLSDLGTASDSAWSLWNEPGATVEQWWSCETFDRWPVARAGIDHRTFDRSATEARGLAGPGEDGQGYEEQKTTWDGQSYVRDEGDEHPVPPELGRPRLPFPDADAVLARFGMTDPAVSTGRDPTGAVYTRYESLPLGRSAPPGRSIAQLGGRWERNVVWVLDVWLDGTGRPVRVRQMVDGDPGRFEWLRLAEPTGDSTPPPCTEGDTAGAGPWLGSEPWTPTLDVPLRVAFDDAGHPYEPGPVEAGAAWSPIGDGLASPAGIVAVTSLEALSSEADWENAVQTFTVAPGTTLRVEQFEGGRGGQAHRIILGGPGGQVSRWLRVSELDLAESTPVVAVGGAEPGFDSESLSAAFHELNTGAWPGHRLDLDDDGVDDAMVLSGSGRLTAVYVGEDTAGRTVELVTVTDELAWRLLDLAGEPPAEVLARERELAECVAGSRPVQRDGVCQRTG